MSQSENESSMPELVDKYPHLAKKTLSVIELSTEKRIAFLYEEHWISYKLADKVLKKMFKILSHPRDYRINSMLLTGDSNNGKSHILKRFKKLIQEDRVLADEYKNSSIIFVDAPEDADNKKLVIAILEALGAPYNRYCNINDLQAQLKDLIAKIDLRAIVMDEVQNVISGSTKQHQACLGYFKSLINKYGVSILAAGVPSAEHAITFDEQIESRFWSLKLPKWRFDGDFFQLTLGMLKLLPLKEPSDLDKDFKLLEALYDYSAGKIGWLWILLSAMAELELENKNESISLKTLEAVRKDRFSNIKRRFKGIG